MKKTILLLAVLITASAQACFFGETGADYQTSLANAYESFSNACNGGCFPILPTCERDHVICFEKALAKLERKYDCAESSVLVEKAARSCLKPMVPLSTDR